MLKPGQNHSLLLCSSALQRALPTWHNAKLCSTIFPSFSPWWSCSRNLIPDLLPIYLFPNDQPQHIACSIIPLCKCGFPYSVPCTPHHTKKWMLFTTTSLVPWLNSAMFGIWWFCGMGLRRDTYEVKAPLNLSSKWDLWALFQLLDSSCQCSIPQPLSASGPKAPHCTSSHQPKTPCTVLVAASFAARSGQVSGWGNRQLSCIC